MVRNEQGGEPEGGRHSPGACLNLLQIGLHQMLAVVRRARRWRGGPLLWGHSAAKEAEQGS